MALRPRGRAMGGQRGAQGGADAWQEATWTSPRGRPYGAPRGRQVGGGLTGRFCESLNTKTMVKQNL